jgi:hypothetical protein
MAAINSNTFNAGSTGVAGVYAPGDPIEVDVNFAPDAPSVVAEQLTWTSTLTNAAGVEVATSSAPFTVNQPQPGGDVCAGSDSGGRIWTPGAVLPQADGSLTAPFSGTA